ncbi:MAG: hypothetical protein RL260_3134, partial [Pseudomonadota bacterium]
MRKSQQTAREGGGPRFNRGPLLCVRIPDAHGAGETYKSSVWVLDYEGFVVVSGAHAAGTFVRNSSEAREIFAGAHAAGTADRCWKSSIAIFAGAHAAGT